MQEKNRQLAEMTALYLQERADRLEITDPLIDVLKGIDRNSMRRYADDLVKVRGCGTAAVLNQTESGIFEYVIITSHDAGLRKLAKELNSRLQGRGGGSDEMIQGTFAAPEEEIRRTLQEMLAVHD
jgi:alanyl-tRNA synthetase